VRGVARTSGEEVETKSGDCAGKCAGHHAGNDAGRSEVLSYIHHTDKVIIRNTNYRTVDGTYPREGEHA
jgi:hypothetical protein